MQAVIHIWKSKKQAILVSFFLFLGLVLRSTQLEIHPSGLHNDEASFFYNAISLKETGKDEDNRKWPIFLNSFIDPKPALYSYLQIPFISLMGNTTAASRMPAALMGSLSLVFIYLLAREVIDKKQAILLLFLMVISPWHLILSRATQEVVMSFFFSMLCLLSFTYFCKGKIRLIAAVVTLGSFALAIYSYHSAKVFLPLTLLATYLFFTKEKKRQLIQFVPLFIVSVLLFVEISFGLASGLTRFGQVSIFSQANPQLILEEQTRIATPYLPGVLIRLFHNKLVNYGMAISELFFQHFTPDFLFFQGGSPARYAVPFHGIMYLIELPLLLFGLVKAFSLKKHQKIACYFGLLLLFSPLAAAITTQEVPSEIRAFTMVLPLLYFVSVAITELWGGRGMMSSFLKLVVLAGYLWGTLYFANQYLVQQPNYHPWSRNYADQEMAAAVKQLQSKFTTVRITRSISGDPYIYLALNGTISHSEMHQSYSVRKQTSYTIGKFRFVTEECSLTIDPHMLYVIPAYCELPTYYKKLKVVGFKDNAAAYAFVQFEPSLYTPSAPLKK